MPPAEPATTPTPTGRPSDTGQPAPFLSRERIVARPGFNRWLVPPAALAIHLCIGMSYGLSIFWLPLTTLGKTATEDASCARMTTLQALVTRTCAWDVSDVVPVFSIGIVMLGLSAAVFGTWVERRGPRTAGVVAALCWGSGFLISALGVHLHQLWLIWLGLGVVGGIGLGLGYISPVSTLIRWFPDRRGMATGMAIMGFGGGAMVGSPLAPRLLAHFARPGDPGVWQTMVTLGLLHLAVMLVGALGYRVPAPGWQPSGADHQSGGQAVTHGQADGIPNRSVGPREAMRTRAFWLLWAVLGLNVTAGIGVLAVASPMLQEIFGGTLIGRPGTVVADLPTSAKTELAAMGAGFVGLLSLFNIGGRFAWASLSDRLGRKATYAVFFALGAVLYAVAAWAAMSGSLIGFTFALCGVLSMYGGGFATIPAYLSDLFGTGQVGAIHGRLLTAWSVAGVVGPMLVAKIRERQVEAGRGGVELYATTLWVLAGLLALGFVCNLLIPRLTGQRTSSGAPDSEPTPERPITERVGNAPGAESETRAQLLLVGAAWLAVGLPLLWGISVTVTKAAALLG